MIKEYTYYEFWDDLCGDGTPDNYRMGPDGFEFQVQLTEGFEWNPSGFADIEDLMENAVGEGRFKEVNVDG